MALGACHAPHQAPCDLIKKYDAVFDHGWDVEREQRLARQIALGIVPDGNHAAAAQRHRPRLGRRAATASSACSRRLQAAYAAMLDHADQHLARLMGFLETAGQLDNTLVLIMSDNGASQEGGPFGMVNAMGPYNLKREPIEEKIARIDDIGGPTPHSNFPLGWAMAANTPLAATSRTPTAAASAIRWSSPGARASAARGELRHQFCHASDLAPTLLDVVGVKPPKAINGVKQMPIEGTSFATSLRQSRGAVEEDARSTSRCSAIAACGTDGWKAVSLPSAGHALRPRPVGALPPRPRLQRGRRSRRRASPSGSRR